MFDQCWANVVDGGPTLVEHWVDVSWLLGDPHILVMRAQCTPNLHDVDLVLN